MAGVLCAVGVFDGQWISADTGRWMKQNNSFTNTLCLLANANKEENELTNLSAAKQDCCNEPVCGFKKK